VLLARQPLATVRPAYAALAACGALAAALHFVASPAPPGPRATGFAVAALGLVGVFGWRLPAVVAAVLAAAVAVTAGLAVDLPSCGRAAALAATGGAAGVALFALLVWGGIDYASRRLGPVAGAVAGAWIAAIGVMSAVLPA
jgi:urease accessory protein